MFTGIIEEIGEVVSVHRHGDCAVLTLSASGLGESIAAGETEKGASVAVNGVCLTVTGWTVHPRACHVAFDVMGETLERSVIGTFSAGTKVNLERAVRADSRLDGHVVQGHVDGTGVVVSRTPGEAWDAVRFELAPELARFVAEKGAIAVDGVSLTVTAVGPDWFEVGLIPETLRATTLGCPQPGDAVNIEVDVLAKYVARLMDTA